MIQARFCTVLTSSWHLNQVPVAAPWLVRALIQKARPMIKTLAQSEKALCSPGLLNYQSVFGLSTIKKAPRQSRQHVLFVVITGAKSRLNTGTNWPTNLMTEKQFKQLWSFFGVHSHCSVLKWRVMKISTILVCYFCMSFLFFQGETVQTYLKK